MELALRVGLARRIIAIEHATSNCARCPNEITLLRFSANLRREFVPRVDLDQGCRVSYNEQKKEVAMSNITIQQARTAIDAAREKSQQLGVRMNIAIVDAGANLKAFARMDEAWLGSIDISIKKAKTARLFNMNSGEIGRLSQPGGDLYNIEHSNEGLITFPGGIPLKDSNGEVIGAIGVSGSTVEEDHVVAAAGATAVS